MAVLYDVYPKRKNVNYVSYNKLAKHHNASSKPPEKYKDQCLYCGDIMIPDVRYDNTKNAWVASLVCSNVECGASSPKKWARKKKSAINAIMNTYTPSFSAEKTHEIENEFVKLNKVAESTTLSVDEFVSAFESFSSRNSTTIDYSGVWRI